MAKKKDNKGIIILLGLLLLGGSSRRGSGSGGNGSGTGSGYTSSHENRQFSEADLRNAFQVAKADFGATIAGQAEQLYRKETRNFDSGQFRKTFSPGMEDWSTNDVYPFGWSSLETFLNQYPKYKGQFFLVAMTENNTGITKKYIGFPTLEGAVMFVAWTIKKRGNPGYWRSWDETTAQNYYKSLLKYPIQYT